MPVICSKVKIVRLRDKRMNEYDVEMTVGMGFDDKIGNGNGKELKQRMGMGMALILMGINSHRRLVLMTILFCMENNS